jgi:hypothetical protein
VIAAKLNEAYAAQASQEAARRHDEGWRPRASSCGGCLREAAHLAAGFTPRPNSPESTRVFELGHQRGAELARRAKAIWPDAVICNCPAPNWQCEPQCATTVSVLVPGTAEAMSGHFDVWIPSLRTIVDFKTAGGFKMGLLAGGQEGAGEDYEMQLQAYRHGISGSLTRDVSMPDDTLKMRPLWTHEIRCVLVFEGKDSDARKGITAGQFIELEVPHTEALEARFQARMKAIGELANARAAGTLEPTTIPGMQKGHWRCKEKDGVPLYCSIGPKIGKCA